MERDASLLRQRLFGRAARVRATASAVDTTASSWGWRRRSWRVAGPRTSAAASATKEIGLDLWLAGESSSRYTAKDEADSCGMTNMKDKVLGINRYLSAGIPGGVHVLSLALSVVQGASASDLLRRARRIARAALRRHRLSGISRSSHQNFLRVRPCQNLYEAPAARGSSPVNR
jgi:hypothetical protein